MMDLAESAGQERLGEVGLVEKVERFEQRFGVGLGGVGEGPDDPGVAALLLDVAQRLPRPPEHGVPPVEGRHEELEEPDMVIAAAQMGELVDDQRRALAVVEALPEVDRDDQPRPPAQRPDQRRELAVDPPD